MKNNKKLRVLLLSAALAASFAVPAFAMDANEIEDTEETSQETVQNEVSLSDLASLLDGTGVEIDWDILQESGEALTPDGNLTLVDDTGDSSGEGKQFITMVTKSGNYFYLIIDRDKDGNENVHLLNLVDESDLLSLMDEDDVAAYQEQKADESTQEEPDEAAVAETDASTTDITEETQDTETAEEEETPAENSNSMTRLLPFAALGAVIAAGAGFFLYRKTKKNAATKTTRPDPDGDDEDEYEIPEDARSAQDDYPELPEEKPEQSESN